MKTLSTNKGLDYSGPGSTVNRNAKTRIRYGIISQRHVMPEALGDIFQNGTDLDYQAYLINVKDKLRSALSDYFSDRITSGNLQSKLEAVVDDAFDAIEQEISDVYEGTQDCTRMEYESDGYKLLVDGSGDLWVLDSEFFTYAQFCSPCAPGACSLSTPVEPDDNNKAYCLGPDWFDNDQPPYPVYSVKTGELIQAGE